MVRYKQALAWRGGELSTSPLLQSNLNEKMSQPVVVCAPFSLEEMGIGPLMRQLQPAESAVRENSRPQPNG